MNGPPECCCNLAEHRLDALALVLRNIAHPRQERFFAVFAPLGHQMQISVRQQRFFVLVQIARIGEDAGLGRQVQRQAPERRNVGFAAGASMTSTGSPLVVITRCTRRP